jgi:Ca-activated chloride channel family protein
MIFAKAIYLLLLPVLIGFALYEWRQGRSAGHKLFGRELEPLMLRAYDPGKMLVKKALVYLGLFFLIIALARPQWGTKARVLTAPTSDIIFAVDVSKSMLAADLKPNRLENAKQALRLISLQLAGNRLGLVAFAGSSFIECPLTGDVGAVALFLDSINTNLIQAPGTDLGGALHTAIQAFDRSPTGKAIILITDGEDLSGGARGAADEAAAAGIKIFPLGLGTEVGETVPEVDEAGNISGMKKKRNGELVVSKLDVALLHDLAGKTGGKEYLVGDKGSTLTGLMAALANLPKNRTSQKLAYQYYDHFPIFLFLAFVCLLTDLLLTGRKKG